MAAIDQRTKLRKFGLTVGIAFLVLAAIIQYRSGAMAAPVLGTLGGALVLFGLVLPQALGPVEKAWMSLAMVLSWINTRIILTVLFAIVFTPIGLVMRLFRDPLNLAFRDGRTSYWVRREAKPFDRLQYERQF